MLKKKVSNSANRIKELLEMNNMSQADFCRKTGLSRSIVSLYINGKREPAQDNIFAISQNFNVDPAWVMGFDVPMNRKYATENAAILAKVRNDEELTKALKVYFSLPEDKKKYAIKLIKMLAD